MDTLVDVWGKSTSGLAGKKLFLFDMDGTIYREDRLFDGTLDLLDLIEALGGRYVFITNNSSKSVDDYIKKVTDMGIRAGLDNFFTSTQASALYLMEHYPGKTVYCQGTRSLVQELKDFGVNVTEEVADDVDVILVGFDTELTSLKLRKTSELLLRDIPFIATNPDLRCPVSFGYVPDCGSMCQMFENTTGRTPVYIGKPEPTMIEIVMRKFGFGATETLVIGDRLYTDIVAGLNAGVDVICVLSGEATKQDILSGDIRPTYTFENVRQICSQLAELEGLAR